MDFRKRLQLAADRGMRTRSEREKKEAAEAYTEEEYRRLHSNYRLELSDHIEACLGQLADNFPGFKYETLVGETGWGGAVSRDDLEIDAGKRRNAYSRLQVLVGTFNTYHVLEISAKGAVRNKENFNRQHYAKLDDADLDDFRQLIERWVLDYAEHYAAG
ncbi:hypothetical protein NG895_08905 [Aeoliella sp. ICT_H6.2]|uniref:Uncharacterized protein n=1 Tax=Aeoliella straminimaris TaxID=2954799 RepID=A0A9X2FGT3_9BACT|nr:hypothetical protein [Aeoliella straminimaris]MCO6044026.1 hypothetical protein [Aeoliella straminimaris]